MTATAGDDTTVLSCVTILEMFKYSLRTVYVKYCTVLGKNHPFPNPYQKVTFKMLKEAYLETLYQYFPQPFHDGKDIQKKLPISINNWVSKHAQNIQDNDFSKQLANEVFEYGMKSSTFSLTNFTVIMVDIFFHSGTRKHKTTFHDWLIFLLSNINIATVAVTPTFKVFQVI